jgi:serine/threonine protein kinase
MVRDERWELWGTLLDGRYRVLEALGTGATGVVLSAVSEPDGKPVAIKVLRSELAQRADLSRRLRQEAVASRSIRHPGIVPCLADGSLPDGSPYVVFEQLAGESLLHFVRRRGVLSASEAIAVARKTARVLAAVHGAGFVHRDVKSEHVWLSVEAGALQVSLLDFGVCLAPDAEPCAQDWQVLGTPGYLAPEQASGEERASPRSDLYGLGATLFEALTGKPPFSGANVAVLLRLALSQDAEPVGRLRRDVPRALERLVQALLARAPEGRPLNARMVERALVAAADTPLAQAELSLVKQLEPAPDEACVETLDEGRPTRDFAVAANG